MRDTGNSVDAAGASTVLNASERADGDDGSGASMILLDAKDVRCSIVGWDNLENWTDVLSGHRGMARIQLKMHKKPSS